MTGIVIELQQKALDPHVRVADLLRMALVVAKKLSLTEFAEWVQLELDGYNGQRPPEYRVIRGQVKGHNPVTRQWMPVLFEDSKMAEKLCAQRTTQPIAELEHLVSSSGKGGGVFHLPFPESLRSQISRNAFGFETSISLFSDRASLVGILDAVRNAILNWSLKLEEAGIKGDGFSFTVEEKRVAKDTPQNINNFFAPIHGGAQIQQGNETATQTQTNITLDVETIRKLVARLREITPSLDLSVALEEELRSELDTLESQADSPKPKESIIREGLKSVRGIIKSVATTAAAQALVVEIGKLLG